MKVKLIMARIPPRRETASMIVDGALLRLRSCGDTVKEMVLLFSLALASFRLEIMNMLC